MSLLPTLTAVAVGMILGFRWGGSIENAIGWRPPLWQALLGGIAVPFLVDLAGLGGSFGAFLVICSTLAILTFAVVNVRVGGMILLCTGVAFNLIVTLVNWGMPVSESALVSAGIVEKSDLAQVTMTGGRHVAQGASLGFLGDVIPLPWRQVISIGDLLILVGAALVTANVLRRYVVGGGRSFYSRPRGPQSYRSALDALGQGPAPRRGPGLHPSRLSGKGRQSVKAPRGRSRI